MTIEARQHTITDAEIEDIRKFGFEIVNTTAETPEAFINKTFPHCNVAHFLSQISALLTDHCPQPPKKALYLNEAPPELSVSFYAESLELALLRKFYHDNGEVYVEHKLFNLPEGVRGKGVAKKLFQISVQEYVNIGVRKIFLYANMETGGYAWARNHFTALKRSEMDVILEKAKAELIDIQFDAVKTIYDNYYNKLPTGEAFPIVKWAYLPFMKNVLLGTSWHGSLDLQDKDQFSNFIKYVFGEKST